MVGHAVHEKKSGPLLLLYISFFSFVAISLPVGLLNIAWTYMQDTFEVSIESLGVLLTFATVGNLIATFSSGQLVAWLRIGPFLLLGAVIATLGSLGYVLMPTWPLLLAAAFITYFGVGMIDAGMNTFVSARFSAGPLNWMHAFFGLGLTLAPFFVTFIIVNLEASWRWSYLAAVTAFALLSLMIVFTLPRWRIGSSAADDSTSQGAARPDAPLLRTLRLPIVMLSVLFFFIYGGVEIGTGQLANTLLLDGRGVDQATAGFWVGIYWGSFTVGRMIAGTVISRFSLRSVMRWSIAGTLLGAVLLWANPVMIVGFLGLGLMGFAQAPIFAIQVGETPRRVGLSHVANSIGLQIGFTGLGGALLPGFIGLVTPTLGVEFISFFTMLACVLLLIMHEVILRYEARMMVVPASGD